MVDRVTADARIVYGPEQEDAVLLLYPKLTRYALQKHLIREMERAGLAFLERCIELKSDWTRARSQENKHA